MHAFTEIMIAYTNFPPGIGFVLKGSINANSIAVLYLRLHIHFFCSHQYIKHLSKRYDFQQVVFPRFAIQFVANYC